MEVRLLHLENTPSPILVTVFGMVTDAKLSHSRNAQRSMLTILSGIVIDFNPEFAKEPSGILVIPEGIENDLRPLQPLNKYLPI